METPDKTRIFETLGRQIGGRRAVARLFVPGRVEFLGKHTDYAGGRSLLCTVDRGFHLVVAPRADEVVRMVDPIDGATAEFPLDAGAMPNVGHWSNYPATVARRVARNFPGDLRGADVAFHSTLPRAAGLSSSSAFVVATFMALDAVNDLSSRDAYRASIRSTEDLAGYLGTVENGQSFGALTGDAGVGTFGGSQDHTAILCGRAGMLRQYAFRPVRHERDVPFPPDHVLVIGVSGVVAEKTGPALKAYNDVSLRARAIEAVWRRATGESTSLGDVVGAENTGRLRELLEHVTDGPYSLRQLSDRFDQFVAEVAEIIPGVADALANGRVADVGPLIDRSQANAERLLGNQIPETTFLARSARELGAVASSAFGAGVWRERVGDGEVRRRRRFYAPLAVGLRQPVPRTRGPIRRVYDDGVGLGACLLIVLRAARPCASHLQIEDTDEPPVVRGATPSPPTSVGSSASRWRRGSRGSV
jgi:galactokinase